MAKMLAQRTAAAAVVPRCRPLSVAATHALGRAAIHLTLAAGGVVILIPFFWMVSTSLKDPGYVFLYPPQFLPPRLAWENYPAALTELPFLTYFRNTVVITGSSVVGQLVSSAMVAYAMSRLRWPGRDTCFLIILSTMMLPHQVTLIPQFILFKQFGWFDTFYPLIVPRFFGAPFFIFLLRQFFMTLSREIDDAARIDGCGNWLIFWRIVLPLSKPALAAVAIFSFQWHWNDFFEPLIYLQTMDNYTASLALRYYSGFQGTRWHLLMAVSLVAMAPCIILFFTAQRYFIQGVVFTGVKG